jgi:hypothetical protein
MTSIEDLTTKFNTRSSTFMAIGQTRKKKQKRNERIGRRAEKILSI